jgi:hypothetical protein
MGASARHVKRVLTNQFQEVYVNYRRDLVRGASANGSVVVPKDRCRNAPLTGVHFEFKGGKLQNFQARKGAECFAETMAPYTSKDTIGLISFGLNPELRVIENETADYRPQSAAGIVLIGTGQNYLEGGNNKEPGGTIFPITNATVEIDGKVLIRDGKITR